MTSWIYLFSKITPELLLFEALIIFVLCAGYCAFWILRKRRYGSVDSTIPSGPIKTYLNELIYNSEQVRLQLFGLVGNTSHSTTQFQSAPTATETPKVEIASDNPEAAERLAALEEKLLQQGKTLQELTTIKAALEKEIADLKAAEPDAGAGQNADDAGSKARLQQRIKGLEEKLAEYNVIEDDLANLKRLKQENTALKSLLTEHNIPLPKPNTHGSAAPTPPVEPTPEPAPASEAMAGAISAELLAKSTMELEADTASTPTNEPATQPLEDTIGAPPATASEPLSTPGENEKPQADYVDEFEKILKSE